MRYESIRVRGLGPFRDEVSLDLAGIDGRLVAVTGPNGAGKSTLLELLLGGSHRTTPTRGSLVDLATTRDAYVEVGVENGASYRIRQTVDKVSGKGEAIVVDASGVPLIESGKVRDYDAWAAAHLPPLEVLLCSSFAAQGSAGFLDMKPSDRKAVLLRILGIERYERLAEGARERGRASKDALRVVSARLDDERARGGDLDELSIARNEAERAAWSAEAALEAARERLAVQEEAVVEVARLRAEAEALAERRRSISTHLADVQARIPDLEARIRNNRGVLGQESAIRDAQASEERLIAAVVAADRELARLRAEREAIEQRARTHEDAARGHDQAAARARARVAEADSRLAGRAALEQQAGQVDALRQALDDRAAARDEASAALDALRGQRLAGAGDRIVRLRGALTEIADGCDYPDRRADEAIGEDDDTVAAAAELPAALAAAESALRTATDLHDAARRDLASAEGAAARVRDLASLDGDRARAAEEEGAAKASAAVARGEATKATGAAHALAAESTSHTAAREAATRDRTPLAPLLRMVEPLAQARARIAELEPQLVLARADETRLGQDLAALPTPAVAPELPDIEASKAAAAAAERAARDAHAAATLAGDAVARARESVARVAALEEERRTHEEELADWTRLGEDLGRDGLQALEIDAAGPELTAGVNDLLHACAGTRFTVSIETTRASADGKRTLEALEVRVLDTEGGREAPVETYSGGERVLIGEAVALALSVLACRRAGVERPTLVRDESGAALDAERGRAYMAMLRRAADLVGADRVLFVSHSAELQELADARVTIGAGGLHVG